MTREEILKDYEVNERGVIKSPGKFEQEMLYVPHFWDELMLGDGEILYFPDGEVITILEITDEDRKEFPELGNDLEIALGENEQGFVAANTNSGQIADIRKEYETSSDLEEEKPVEESSEINVTESLESDKALVIKAFGYTDIPGQLRAAYLLGTVQAKVWKKAVKDIKKKCEKEMKDRVDKLAKWGTIQPSEEAVRDVIAKVLQEHNIYPYPQLVQELYKNPFQERGYGSETAIERQKPSEDR
jgi:hypothetical protein